MTKSATELYQEVVLAHNRDPRGYGELLEASRQGEGFNPICGDQINVQIIMSDETIERVGFTARCCALCRASASVMTTVMSGLSMEAAEEKFKDFEIRIQGRGARLDGDAAAFAAIAQYPARAKCVILPWKTFFSALKGSTPAALAVSTES